MSTHNDHETLRHIAEQVADCFSACGYAFVEDDKLEALAATLQSFLAVVGIPVNAANPAGAAPTAVGRPHVSSSPGQPRYL